MRKVFHLIPTVNIGGAETMVKDYALLLNKDLFDVKIVSIDKSYHSVNEKELEAASIPIVYLSELHYNSGTELNLFQKIKKTIYRYVDLRRMLREERPDVLHVHLHVGKYLRFVPLKRWGIKTFYTVHNELSHYFDKTGQNKKKYHEYLEIKRLVHTQGVTLIALQEKMKCDLQELFDTNQVCVVNNGVKLSRFRRELYSQDRIRSELGIKEDAYIVGHVGRFHEQKNHEFLIQVFFEMLQVNNKCHLLLVGSGELREQVEQKIEELGVRDFVTILQNRSDIPELMCAMDVFLFPSKWEGFGNVLIEAQSMGVPCVISDKVPQDTMINDNVRMLSLQESIDTWVNSTLNMKIGVVKDNIRQFDILNCVKTLEKLYCE